MGLLAVDCDNNGPVGIKNNKNETCLSKCVVLKNRSDPELTSDPPNLIKCATDMSDCIQGIWVIASLCQTTDFAAGYFADTCDRVCRE
jgi:hypothetical protein